MIKDHIEKMMQFKFPHRVYLPRSASRWLPLVPKYGDPISHATGIALYGVKDACESISFEDTFGLSTPGLPNATKSIRLMVSSPLLGAATTAVETHAETHRRTGKATDNPVDDGPLPTYPHGDERSRQGQGCSSLDNLFNQPAPPMCGTPGCVLLPFHTGICDFVQVGRTKRQRVATQKPSM